MAAAKRAAPTPPNIAGKQMSRRTNLHACCEETLSPTDEAAMLDYELLTAAADGNLRQITEAAKRGADIEARRPLVFRTGVGTGLDAKGGDEEDFQEVLVLEGQGQGVFQARSVDVSETQAKQLQEKRPVAGLTPLMRASRNGRVQAVSLLLELRASPDSQDENGTTPLHFAAAAGCRQSCSVLLRHGADRWMLDDDQRDALSVVPREFLGSTKERAEWEYLFEHRSVAD
eukprot:TRINITY_DN12660_c0_g1_i3.p1 TRINITY_DN12660_c0_g1~~TRINITY_DN12660_c0_g1_i3.p1  ORF type:complete len:264 (-),score=54.32 TRINITY_DN12660_c0_g1_i3:100-789(-)